ncbi:hypothetical protein LTR17_013361 [Elasticomyces elasticus]|nr:hypothetical protein LTR17_013361 [Elasticomyces elasticus]
MSSPRSDDVYDNPALDEEGAFRDAEKASGGFTLTDMMEGEERYGEPCVVGQAASYTLALDTSLLYPLVNPSSFLPLLQIGLPSDDGLLNSEYDMRTATYAITDLVQKLRATYEELHRLMTGMGSVEWITLGEGMCKWVMRTANRIVRLADRIRQEYEWHVAHGEVRVIDVRRLLPRFAEWVSGLRQMAIITQEDGLREADFRYQYGEAEVANTRKRKRE